jgi:hypothetical protein
MLSPVQRASLQQAKTPTMDAFLGTYVSRSGAFAVVNVGDQTVTVPNVGQYMPQQGDSVQLELRNGKLVMTGPSSPKPATAKVTVTGSPTITVQDADGVTYQLGYLSTYTPTLDDIVSINWFSGMVEGKPTQALNPDAPATNTPATTKPFVYEFQATNSGSFGSRWFTNDVWSSDSNDGAWFYGPQIADTLKDTALISRVQIWINVRTVNVEGTSNVGVHNSLSIPAGNVSLSSLNALQLNTGWMDLPIAFGDFLKANYGGIGIHQGHYKIFRGTQSDAQSGRLRITGAQ